MAYTPDNNPYIPGDPYSYDLKWQVDKIKYMQTRFDELDENVQEATDQADRAQQEADRAAGRADFATEEADRATQEADRAAGRADFATTEANRATTEADRAESEADRSKDYADHIADPVSGLVTSWLAQHITQPTTPVIDTSLTVEGAAADAKKVGDELKIVDNKINTITKAGILSPGKSIFNTRSGFTAQLKRATQNMLNPEHIVYNYSLGIKNNELGPYSNPGWCYIRGAYINPRYTPGKTYKFSTSGTPASVRVFYLIDGVWEQHDLTASDSVFTFTLPLSATSFSIAFWYQNRDQYMMCESDLYNGYVPYSGYTLNVESFESQESIAIDSNTTFPITINTGDYYTRFNSNYTAALFDIEYNAVDSKYIKINKNISGDVLSALLNSNMPVQLNGNVKLENDITINSNVHLSGSGTIYGQGHNITINGEKILLDSNSTINGNIISASSAPDIKIGDVISIGSTRSRLIAAVKAIDDNLITVDNSISYALYNNDLYKIIIGNSRLKEITFDNVLLNLTDISNVDIDNCKFTNATQISIKGCYFNIINNDFNAAAGIVVWSCMHGRITQNNFVNCSKAIRCVYVNDIAICDNYIADGSNDPHGIGIEISVESEAYTSPAIDTMACYCKISGNTVLNVVHGVRGSAIGGIHLNKGANNNKIIGNTCKFNSIGIYLENGDKKNVIENNICCNQNGYYGVGIELDFDCYDNIICGNICNNNSGQIEADESCGIEVRTGYVQEHAEKRNKIANNTCNNNAKAGIIAAGYDLIITGNTTLDNGSEAFNEKGGLIFRRTAKNVVISNNIFNDGIVSSYEVVNAIIVNNLSPSINIPASASNIIDNNIVIE